MPKPLFLLAFPIWGLLFFWGLDLGNWRYQGDPVLLNYASWLWVEQGQIPYRDIFETSMPGTFVAHALVMLLGLDGDIPFLILSLGLLVTLGGIGWGISRQAGSPGGPLFLAFYVTLMLLFGPNSLFQRELIATGFIATACYMSFRGSNMLWIGLLYGLAALIKPQLALTAPIVVLAGLMIHQRPLLTGVIISVFGFALPLLATGFWLWSNGALEDFVFLLTEYLPLHIQQSTYHVFLAPDDRLKYLINEAVKFGGFWVLVAGPVALTVFQLLGRKLLTRPQIIIFSTLILLSAAYSLLPILAGQFWNYHYFPFIFFSSLSAVSCFGFFAPKFRKGIRALALLTACLIPLLQAALLFDPRLAEKNQRDTEMVLGMEAALANWLPEGGYVQPIDWTKGAIHAMLHARARLATPFLYDYHFRHHVSGPVTQHLRQEFMEALLASPPDIFLDVPTRPKMKGLDISYDWPEFDRFLSQNYKIVETAEHHIIYLRNGL